MKEASVMSRQKTLLERFGATSSPESEDGTTRSSLQDGLTIGQCGPEAVPASHFLQPEGRKENPTKGIYGPNSGVSYRSAILQSYLENRLHQGLDVNGSPEYALTWKKWDMQSGPPICALRAKARPMPETEGDIKDMFRGFLTENIGENDDVPDIVVIERVGGFIKGNPAPGSAMFNFGMNFGFLKACAMCNGFRLELVTPQQWQLSIGLGTRGKLSHTQWKNKLKAEAQRLYPDIKVTNQTADALLILEYARRSGGTS